MSTQRKAVSCQTSTDRLRRMCEAIRMRLGSFDHRFQAMNRFGVDRKGAADGTTPLIEKNQQIPGPEPRSCHNKFALPHAFMPGFPLL